MWKKFSDSWPPLESDIYILLEQDDGPCLYRERFWRYRSQDFPAHYTAWTYADHLHRRLAEECRRLDHSPFDTSIG